MPLQITLMSCNVTRSGPPTVADLSQKNPARKAHSPDTAARIGGKLLRNACIALDPCGLLSGVEADPGILLRRRRAARDDSEPSDSARLAGPVVACRISLSA